MDIRYITSAGYDFYTEVCVVSGNGTGDIVYRYLPVCDPDLVAHEEGVLHIDVKEHRPAIKSESEDEAPSMRSDAEELEPDVRGEDLRPSLKAFPEPLP